MFRRLTPPRPDPIDHPDLIAMSLRDLADLPLPRMPAPPAPRSGLTPAPSCG